MRKISFRGRRVDNDNWVYGYYYETRNGAVFISSLRSKTYLIDPDTVGQYSGIQAAKGKTLYEGDTARIIGGEYENGAVGVDATGTVVFERGSFMLLDDQGVYHSFDLVPSEKIKFVK